MVVATLFVVAGCVGDEVSDQPPPFPNLGAFPPRPQVRTARELEELERQLLTDRAEGQALGGSLGRRRDARLEPSGAMGY